MTQLATDFGDTALVVDDSPETLSYVSDVLEEASITALVARDGEQAISIVGRATPDVILMDAVMPGMDGFETCRRMKRIATVAHVPVIFMTGLRETEHVLHGFEAGGTDYVTKPISPTELIARIRAHLSSARKTLGAQAALDATGRYLLSIDSSGRIVWATPQAVHLLETLLGGADPVGFVLPAETRAHLQDAAPGTSVPLTQTPLADPMRLSVVGPAGRNEVLVRLLARESNNGEARLRQRFDLTPREAEVLIWIARGKANRDAAEILGLSPRTINKHLEQIFNKLGVENRTAAAATALEVLAGER